MIGSEKLNDKQKLIIAVLVILFIAFMVIVELLDNKSLNGIKAKVGDEIRDKEGLYPSAIRA